MVGISTFTKRLFGLVFIAAASAWMLAAQPVSATSSLVGQDLGALDHYFYAYTEPGETLDVNIFKTLNGAGTDLDVTVRVTAPDGTVAIPDGGVSPDCVITAAAATGAGTACVYTGKSSTTAGAWRVSMVYTGDEGEGAADRYRWNVTVRNGANNEVTGRVWTEKYRMFESGVTARDFTLWYQHEFGYTYKADYNDYIGIQSSFSADATGNRNTAIAGSECASIYRSITQSTTDTLSPSYGACGGAYKIFFEAPASDLPADATSWGEGQKWLKRDPVNFVPDISNFSFVHNSTTHNSGNFVMDIANFNGNLMLELDTNNDGDYTDPEDRLIPFGAPAGTGKTVPFDGVDGNGNPIPITQQMTGRVRIDKTGEIHIVNGDVESRGSLAVERLNGPGTLAERSTIYWNDTQIPNDNGHCTSGSSTTLQKDGTAGVVSTPGVHGWPFCTGGGWGDMREIDDWAYVQLNESETTGPISGPEPYDFGDAPDSYGTTLGAGGARHAHSFPDNLRLGATWQDEPDAVAPLDGTGDGADEDGVSGQITYKEGVATSVQVAVHNTSNEPATLVGWLDLDSNGTFEPSERVSVPVAANSGDTTQTLTFPTGKPTADTFARFRLFPGTVTDASPTGVATGGEVEDYAVAAAVLNVTKTVAPAGAVKPGDTVTYTITISSAGSAPVTDVIVSDNLSDVIDDATYNNNAVVSGSNTGSVIYAEPNLTYSAASLPAGATDILTYSATVNNPPKGNKMLNNQATSNKGNCTPGNNDPGCKPEVPTPMSDVNVKKIASKETYKAGDTITYTLTAENTGTGSADFTLVDDMTDVIDDATYNNDAAIEGAGGTTSYTAPNLAYANSALAPGEMASITYSVTTLTSSTGNEMIRNRVGGSEGNCPEGSTSPECIKETSMSRVKLKKTAPTDPIQPGEILTYTVSMTNTGTGVYEGFRMEDDFSDVVDDADYNHDANPPKGSVEFTGNRLIWMGDIEAGETVTFTYSVTVKPVGSGNGFIINSLVDPEVVSNCSTDSTDADCHVQTTLSTALAETGQNISTMSAVMVGFLIMGAGAWFTKRRLTP